MFLYIPCLLYKDSNIASNITNSFSFILSKALLKNASKNPKCFAKGQSVSFVSWSSSLGIYLIWSGFIIPPFLEYKSIYSPSFAFTNFSYSFSASKIKILVPLANSFTIIFFIVKLLPPPVDDTIARLWDVLLLLRINGSKNTGKEVWISTPNMYPVGSMKFAFVNGKPAPNVIVGK